MVHKTGEAKRETKLGGKDRKTERNKKREEEEAMGIKQTCLSESSDREKREGEIRE